MNKRLVKNFKIGEKRKREEDCEFAMVEEDIKEKIRKIVEILNISNGEASNLLQLARNDVDDAIALHYNQTSSTSAPVSSAVTSTHQFKSSDLSFLQTQPGFAGTTSHSPLEDEALQLALEQSRKTGKMEETIPLSKEEAELNMVIERSIKESTGDAYAYNQISNNPNYRKKEESDIAIGLKNIGNTCYFNSMLQTYFMIPDLRKAVLEFPHDMKINDDDPQKDTIIFMKELQRLFVFLLKSNQKYVDPSRLLQRITGEDGKPVKIGDQEDVGDFNELLLNRIATGLKIASERNSCNSEVIQEMFWGTGAEYLSYKDSDGNFIETKKETKFSTLILPVKNESSDLQDCLENYVDDEVEYTTESGYRTVAQSCLWVEKFPQILMFQESRAAYDVEKKAHIKKETPVYFKKEIYVDRYSIQHREETSKRRKLVEKQKSELKNFEDDLEAHTNFKGKGHSLQSAFESLINFYSEKANKDSVDYQSLISTLRDDLTIESKVVSELTNCVDTQRQKIETAYNDLKENPYCLFAVWIHQGIAGSGHYWAYIRDFKQENKWIKFNDMRVSEVDEEILMKEAVGGEISNTSAYFLIYIDKTKFEKFQTEKVNNETLIPESLLREVEEENKKFEKELEDYEEKNIVNKDEKFVKKYQEKIKEVEKSVKDISIKNDPRIASFYVFLDSIGHNELMMSEIIRDLYKTIFDRGIEQDIGFDMYENISKRIGNELIQLATKHALDGKEIEELRSKHQEFIEISFMFHQSLTSLLKGSFIESVRTLVQVIEKDRKFQHETLKREKYFEFVLCVVLNILLEQSFAKYDPNDFSTSGDFFRELISITRYFFPKEHPFTCYVLKELSNWLENNKSRIIDDYHTKQFQAMVDQLKSEVKSNLRFGLSSEKKNIDSKERAELPQKLHQICEEYETKFEKYISFIQELVFNNNNELISKEK